MTILENLLVLYVGVLVINVGLSAVLWAEQRTVLHRALFFLWASGMLSFFAQGALTSGSLMITLGFSAVFAIDLAIAHLLAVVANINVRWWPFLLGIGLAIPASAILHLAGQPFWLVALPVSCGVAAPLLHTSIRTLITRHDRLTTTGRALLYTCFLFCAHNLDFPFLRNREELAALGFTIAILLAFALSITATSVVLERVAAERAEAEQLHRLKNQFFANISHELRTPLTMIIAPVEAMQERLERADDRRELQMVQRNASRLLRLIDELLDLSQVDAGGLRLNVAAVDLCALAASVHEVSAPAAKARSLEFDLAIAGPISNVYGDAHRLEIVLTNLVGNAIKYTPEGGRVVLSVRERAGWAIVEVSDTGPGIPDEALPRVFERFFQIGAGERRREGAGIGLALAKELAELHGGKLEVASKLGQGTTFSLALQLGTDHFRKENIERRKGFRALSEPGRRFEDVGVASSTITPEATRRPVDLGAYPWPLQSRGRVLVVDDHAELRGFIASILSPSFDVIEATGGDEGLRKARDQRPDIIVSDIMMPGLSGTELCASIKSDPNLRATPVILLTAKVGSEATLEAYARGANDFVAKPFHPQVLLARVEAQLRLRQLSLQLVSREKLAAIGTLAAGVAHEVRNPINSIANAASVLLDGKPEPATTTKLLHIIADGCGRIGDIVSALDSHAHPAEGTADALANLQEGLESTVRLLAHKTQHVDLHLSFPRQSLARIPPGKINQVFLNLLDNAIGVGAANIWVSVEAVGAQLLTRIADDGPGVPPEIAERVFDAFFTTREPGEGTGLGLYLSRNIVVEHGGQLTLHRRAGGGTEFRVMLPSASRNE